MAVSTQHTNVTASQTRQTDAARRQRPRFDAQIYPSGDITAHGDYRLVGSGYEYRLVLFGIQKIPHLVCRG